MRIGVLDIETETDMKTVRMVGIRDISTNVDEIIVVPRPNKASSYGKIIEKCNEFDEIWTWNGARFDFPVMDDAFGITMEKKFRHLDLMLLAKMMFPERHRYGLDIFCKEEVGRTAGKTEVDYDESSDEELAAYLVNDLYLTECAGRHIKAKRHYHENEAGWLRAMSVETKVAESVEHQVRKGVRLDMTKAGNLAISLRHEIEELEEKVNSQLPFVDIPKHKLHYPPKIQFRKDGSVSLMLEKYAMQYGWRVISAEDEVGLKDWMITNGMGGLHPLPISNPLQTSHQLVCTDEKGLKQHLLDEGWQPTEWNEKEGTRTSPRISNRTTKEPCADLVRMKLPWIKDYITWRSLRNRLNVVDSSNGTGWIPRARIRHSGAPHEYYTLPSDADTLGANTHRFTHKIIANVPRVSSPKGKEMRELFCARDGAMWVGWDADSLEACMEAHYVYPFDPAYAEELMDGDIHTTNLHRYAFLKDRDAAKTWKYAMTYGVGAKNLAKQFDLTPSAAKRWWDKFWEDAPALSKVRRETIMERSTNGGWITGLDGRLIMTRSDHSALNAKFQSAGAIVMKYSAVIAEHYIRQKHGRDAYPLVRYHDEEIYECDPEIVASVAKIGEWSVKKAGEVLKLNVPLSAQAKIGHNWAEVH